MFMAVIPKVVYVKALSVDPQLQPTFNTVNFCIVTPFSAYPLSLSCIFSNLYAMKRQAEEQLTKGDDDQENSGDQVRADLFLGGLTFYALFQQEPGRGVNRAPPVIWPLGSAMRPLPRRAGVKSPQPTASETALPTLNSSLSSFSSSTNPNPFGLTPAPSTTSSFTNFSFKAAEGQSKTATTNNAFSLASSSGSALSFTFKPSESTPSVAPNATNTSKAFASLLNSASTNTFGAPASAANCLRPRPLQLLVKFKTIPRLLLQPPQTHSLSNLPAPVLARQMQLTPLLFQRIPNPQVSQLLRHLRLSLSEVLKNQSCPWFYLRSFGSPASSFGATMGSTSSQPSTTASNPFGSATTSPLVFGRPAETSATAAATSNPFGGTGKTPSAFPPAASPKPSGSSSIHFGFGKNTTEGESSERGTPAVDDGSATPGLLTPNPLDEEGAGEENEETVHGVKSKAYYLSKPDAEGGAKWLQLGSGILRLKKHKDTGARRVLLRNSTNGKVIVNFKIYSGLKPTQQKSALSFVGHDNGVPQTYSIRLANEGDAKNLKEALEKEIAFVKAKEAS
ncbi:hypothetical protein BDZ97DRAFT_1912650 [Flammula alnicola]|nr:hypothetical protein BDZ97DRAFT_1912650 [Flammula alnicola]